MKVSVLACPVLTAAVLATACGCQASGSATAAPGTTAASTSATTGASTSATTGASTSATAQADPKPCPASALRVGTSPGSGMAMDGVYWDVTFTNVGSATCTLYGYPGVSFLNASRIPITAPASRTGDISHLVTLAHGQTASAQLETPNTGNLPASECTVTRPAFLRVYPPNDTVSVTLSGRSGLVCAGKAPGARLWPVAPGANSGT